MVGRVVAVCDGRRVQVRRVEKVLRKNQNVFRRELRK